MNEQGKLELYGRSRSNGGVPGVLEGRVVEFADSFEILEPQEGPNFRAYARILQKRLPAVLIVFFILFSVVLIATLKQKRVHRAQTLLEIQKENPDIPTIQELYELDSVSDAYLRSQYTILGSESLARRVIDQLGLDSLREFNSPKWWSWPEKKERARPASVRHGAESCGSRNLSASARAVPRPAERKSDQPQPAGGGSVRFPGSRTLRARGQ